MRRWIKIKVMTLKQEQILRVEKMFIILLKAGLWNEHIKPPYPEPLTGEEWIYLISIAKKQTVAAIVFDGVNMLPDVLQPERHIMQQLFAFTLQTERTHAVLNHALSDIVHRFTESGIPTLLLKGQGNAWLYPNPLHRQCGDIDLYVGRKNYEEACRLIHEWGIANSEEESESEKHLHFEWNKVTIEIHRTTTLLYHPKANKRFLEWSEAQLKDSPYSFVPQNETERVTVASPEFNAVFIFYHAFHHFMIGGIGLRQLCDWARCLHMHKEELKDVDMEKRLKELSILTPWKVMGYIAVHYLGLPKEDFPCYDESAKKKAGAVLAMIQKEGNFGAYRPEKYKRPDNYVLGKLYSFFTTEARDIHIARIFPSFAIPKFFYYLYSGIVHFFLDYRKR